MTRIEVDAVQRVSLLFVFCLLIGGCASGYTLVAPDSVQVAKKGMSVTTNLAWNKAPSGFGYIPEEENWTQNGPILDSVTFIAGVRDGSAIVVQKQKDDRQVPVFKANMSPPDLVSMIESYYRIRAGVTVFETTSVQPATFLDGPGMQVDYRYIGADDVKRKGRSVLIVTGDKLYMMSLDGVELHYYDSLLPEFESMVRSARIL